MRASAHMEVQEHIATIGFVLCDLEVRNAQLGERRDVERVGPLDVHDYVAVIGEQAVVATAALKNVGAIAADDEVIAVTAIDDVVPRAAVDGIRAGTP